MLHYIKGTTTEILDSSIIIECGGLGINVIVSNPQAYKLNNIYKIYTYLLIGEKDFKLVGFISKQEYHLFLKLIQIKGIGVKTSLDILKAYSPNELNIIIENEQATKLKRIKGIGNKTIELIFSTLNKNKQAPLRNELLLSLKALGYQSDTILEAIRKTSYPNGISLNDAIKLTLKNIL